MSGPGSAPWAGESTPAAAPNDPVLGRAVPAATARRRRRRWPLVVAALALVGLVGGAAWALLGSRLIAVRSVIVTGTHLVTKAEVLKVASVRLGTPLIRVNTSQIAARVVTIRQVQSVQVSTSWPDRVVITIRERTPALAVAAPGGGFDLVDPDGVTVLWAAHRPSRLPLYLAAEAVDSLRGDPDVAAAAAVLAELPASLRHSLISITAPNLDQVTLNLSNGITILWGSASDASAKAKELALLMRTHARYYDVSAPGTVMTN
ncbi:MAG: cell division protein FtsQ/DivIB [Streptosporangiaceae bacterium]